MNLEQAKELVAADQRENAYSDDYTDDQLIAWVKATMDQSSIVDYGDKLTEAYRMVLDES